ncbi:MAG: hypothetical protein K6G65_00285, partial [Lachnospiraceae bacterium]|nr:hypothetical protein [Lachnospiraceae bacterium]
WDTINDNNKVNQKKILIIGSFEYDYGYEARIILKRREEIEELKRIVDNENNYEIVEEVDYTDSKPEEKFGDEERKNAKEILKKHKDADIIIIGIEVAKQKEVVDMLKDIGFSLGDKQKIYSLTNLLGGGEENFDLVANGEIEACICTDISSQIEGAYDAMFKILKGEEVTKMNPAKFQVITKENAKDYRNLPCYKMFRELGCDSTGEGKEWD